MRLHSAITSKMNDVPPFNWPDLVVVLSAFAVFGMFVGLALRWADRIVAEKRRTTALHHRIPDPDSTTFAISKAPDTETKRSTKTRE